MADLDSRAAGARRFEGQVAIVAGAGQGIGRATARRLAQEGAAVVVADQVEETAQRVCKEIAEFGERATGFVGDLREIKDVQALMERAKKTYGRIDALANIVGGSIWHYDYQLLNPEQIEATVKKNFWPSMWLCWAVLPYMLEQGSGAICNVATHAVASTGRVPYAASKGGVIALTTSLAKEVAAVGIRVNCIAPGSSRASDRVTPRSYGVPAYGPKQPPSGARWFEIEGSKEREERHRWEVPMGRDGKSEEQASAIVFLLSHDASFITGQILPVGGGATYPF
jgi:dihydroxycyclohexadiene carboxylate dehydrogenase